MSKPVDLYKMYEVDEVPLDKITFEVLKKRLRHPC
jgi:hypothetical protein